MLRNSWGGVGWGWWRSLHVHTCAMLGNCCSCTHVSCSATHRMLRNCCSCTHVGCYAILLAHMLHATQLSLHTRRDNHRLEEYVWSFCSEWTRGRTCLKHWVNWPKKQTMREDGEKTTSFFRRMIPIRTNSTLNAFVKTPTHGKNGAKWTYEPTCHKLKSTPLQHFVHLQQKAIAQGRNHGRNLV